MLHKIYKEAIRLLIFFRPAAPCSGTAGPVAWDRLAIVPGCGQIVENLVY